ncbi:hypothetical protein DPMN_159120 [Dreissena polymorpha]|uniref:Uncharacterized protein n=1 Tax=Dreissena polymorpha TaxID=45954 RepID=A0A9D4IRH8_DREPO|nr:hypothetical protein DPMN_159120 [Dreissena polymorpha]
MAFYSSGSVGVWITSPAYAETLAPQTSRTILHIVLCATRNPYINVRLLSPVVKNLKVIAKFKPGLMDCLNQVWFFVILGPTTCKSSWNISGPILVKFLKAAVYSAISSAIEVSYWPRAGRLKSQSLIHHLLFLL